MSDFEDIPAEDIKKLIRVNFIWDLLPHEEAADVMVAMGFVPPSPEGQEVSCEASHKRMDVVKPLESDFAYMAEEIATILTKVILGDAAKEVDEELVSSLTKQTATMIEVGSRVVVANLIATKILTLNEKVTKT